MSFDMTVPKSYFTTDVCTNIRYSLDRILYHAEQSKNYPVQMNVKLSIEILNSLTTDNLPVGNNLYEFRKDIITTFYRGEAMTIRPGLVDQYDLPMAESLRVTDPLALVAMEYHTRLFRCLQVVLKYIGQSFSGVSPCRNQRSITG